jgi:hypothetical protein
MPVYERGQLQREISHAKNAPDLPPHSWDSYYDNQEQQYKHRYKDQLDAAFYSQIVAEITSEQIRLKEEKAKVAKEYRDRRTAQWDNYKANNDSRIDQQPRTSHYSDETIGWRGYRWLSNFKAANGKWYAAYQPVRGGETRKYYSISDNDWSDDYQISLRCEACQHYFRSMSPPADNVCPNCGAKADRLSYRGRY